MQIEKISLGYLMILPALGIGRNSFGNKWWIRFDWLFWGIMIGKDDLSCMEELINHQKELDPDIKETIYKNMDKLMEDSNDRK